MERGGSFGLPMGGADHLASGDRPPASSPRGVLLPLPFTPRLHTRRPVLTWDTQVVQ